MQELFFDHINQKLNIPSNQLFFPNHNNITELKYRIENVGGIDTCYGGIGIHGHVAFNEPEPNVKNTDPRLVYLNEYTITINAIRANIGGNLANFPRKALTLGMNKILGAKRIRLYCRNGSPYDWANTILRVALFGTPGDDYPVTHVRNHSDYVITTDKNTLASPKIIL
jgi:glucosamine-6-phosphate deaminase